jgi:hypothetical protein
MNLSAISVQSPSPPSATLTIPSNRVSHKPAAPGLTVSHPENPARIDATLRTQALGYTSVYDTAMGFVAAAKPLLPLMVILGSVLPVSGQISTDEMIDILREKTDSLNATTLSHTDQLAAHDTRLTALELQGGSVQESRITALESQILELQKNLSDLAAQVVHDHADDDPGESSLHVGGVRIDYSTIVLAAVVLAVLVGVAMLYADTVKTRQSVADMASPLINNLFLENTTELSEGRAQLEKFSSLHQSQRSAHGFVSPMSTNPVEPPSLTALRNTLAAIDGISDTPETQRNPGDVRALQAHMKTLKDLLRDAKALSTVIVIQDANAV